MEEYAEELRTPPVALVSLVGFPELHSTISSFLHSQKHPINTLALPDFSKITLMAGKQKETLVSDQSCGILKKNWLIKHRTRIPSVVAAMFTGNQVSGDPAQWLQVCTDLDNLKSIVRGRNIKLVVVIVQSNAKDELSEDRIIALRKRAEVDSRHLLVFAQNDAFEIKESLNRLASIFAELSTTFYKDDGRRIKLQIDKKNLDLMELNVRYCFKVAVYAEFRRDWAEALKFYEDGYYTLREVIATTTRLPPIQRLVEIKAVAEQFHFKISTLLLHGGKLVEAITWFKQHNIYYKRFVGLTESGFLHWEWMSRQFLVFAELLETSFTAIQSTDPLPSDKPDQSLTKLEFQPAYYYQFAAYYLSEKRYCLDLPSFATLEDHRVAYKSDSSTESVIPSSYVGQFSRLPHQEDKMKVQPLTDEEFLLYALSEGKRFQDSYEIIALLRKSYESYDSLKFRRMASHCGHQMAIEYFSALDFNNARQIFDRIASSYRQEGWVTLLWEVLGYLRECSKNLASIKDFFEYSIEMASLPIFGNGVDSSLSWKKHGPAGPPSLSQREVIHDEVFGLLKENPSLKSNEDISCLKVTKDKPLQLEIDPVSPLRAALLSSVAFHDQVVKPGALTLLTVSLFSQLPHPVEIDQLEIKFNQSICNFIIRSVHKSPLTEQCASIETVPVLTLTTNKWLRLTYPIQSGQSGKLECLSVTAKIGENFSICCRAESPASMEELLLWKFEDRVGMFPTKDPSLSFSSQKAIQVEEPEPQVDLVLGAINPALVGEIFTVPVTLTSTGHEVHSGELKINLMDARGGLLSPRETDSLSSNRLEVELLSVSGSIKEDSHSRVDNVHNIQQTFGLVSVPFLDIGKSWSCKLDIKWHKPKTIMLYVSLGYSPNSDNEDGASHKINVHKSVELQGETPITITHRFMMPFRCEPLLLSKVKMKENPNQLTSLPLNDSVLIIHAKSCTKVPLRLISMSIKSNNSDEECPWIVQNNSHSLTDLALLNPGEEFKRVFFVHPKTEQPELEVGTVNIQWIRNSEFIQPVPLGFVTKHKLPKVSVEKPPLVVSLKCPSHAVLGIPFSLHVEINNQTPLLQELKYSLGDSQTFLFSGSHSDVIWVLPNSELQLSYKLIPLFSGKLQLPTISITSVRYSSDIHLSTAASSLFVFPSNPHFATAPF